MILLIIGVIINVMAAITEANLFYEKYTAFAVVNFLLQLCLLASCALLYSAFSRFKQFISLDQILNPKAVRTHAVAFFFYALAMLIW